MNNGANKMNIVWRPIQEKYGLEVMIASVGTIRVGRVEWNNMKSREDVGKNYKYICMLPGFKDAGGLIATKNDGMATIENMVNSWFKAVGVE